MWNKNKSTINIISVLIFTLLLLLFCLQSATAVDITNSTAGGISQGISNTPNGGTLGLADGFYESVNNITIDKNLTVKGTSKSNTIIDSDSVAFNVEDGNTLTLYNLTIISNYYYTDDDIADYNSLVHNSNGSVNGPGNIVFVNCLFINNKQTNATVVVTASPTYNTRLANFTATVTDKDGNPVIGDVVFCIDNRLYGRVYASNGIATFNANLANGNYVVHAVYIGNSYGGPWNIIGQVSLAGYVNPKISWNQVSFNVNQLFAPMSVPLPTSGNRYYVDPVSGQDAATRDGLSIANAWRSISYAYNTGASDNSYIILQPGNYTGANNVGITLSNKFNMTIIGNDTNANVTISGAFATLSATGASATNKITFNLYNVIIYGSTTAKLIIQGNAIVNIDYVIFTEGTSTGRGIQITGPNVNLTVNNTKFTNMNLGSDAAAIHANAAAATGHSIVIYNCEFINLSGTSNGGVIRNYIPTGPIAIYNSTFKDCFSSFHGGVFCTNGPYLLVVDTKFINISTNADGGVLWSHGNNDHNFTNTEFINCSAATQGGAIYANGRVNIDNCTFTNNSASTYGGAITSGGTISIIDSNFENNRATSNTAYGGAVSSSGGTININNSNFTNNSAGQYGGAIGATSGTVTVNNSDFRNNFVFGAATVYGGALGATTGTINVYNSEFVNNSARNNTAAASSYGGAAGVNGASATINLNNCTVHGNWAKYGGAFGAGSSGGIINVNSCPAIFDNYALEYGGVVGLSSSGTITLTNCTNIYNNTAGTYGGVFGVIGGKIDVYDSIINNNSAGSFGGVVGINGNNGVVNLYNSQMNDNFALTFGGAIGATGGSVTVRNSSLRRNRVTNGYGGAIGLTTGNIAVYDSEFLNNTATDYGGAVGVPSSGTFYANNSAFTNNEAINGYGGALGSGATVNITYCNFTDNKAGTNGGAVAAMSTTTAVNSILSCQFEFNYALARTPGTGFGNAIYAANRLTAQYNRFFNNSGSTPGDFTNTMWTNMSQSANVNIDFNWWGENRHWAIGITPNNWVVVNVSNPVFKNGSAHYTYTIGVSGNNTAGFNVSRLPSFFGDIHFTQPPFNSPRNFTAHENNTVIILPFTVNATQEGYFQVDNQILNFTVRTNTTPNITNITVNLGNTSGKYKDNVNLTATFNDIEGYPIAGLNITFYINNVAVGSGITDANGVATCPYTVATAGPVDYNVTYNHTTAHSNPLYLNYNPVMENSTLNFLKLDTRIVVNGFVTGPTGVPVGLNVTIYDEYGRLVDSGVTISFYGNGTFLGNNITNSASQTILYYAFPNAGNYSWYAYFAGNGNYTSSNSTSTLNGTGTANITPVVNLSIVKSSNATGNVRVGDLVEYYINVTNHGPDIATGVVVTDVLDSRLRFVSASDVNYNNNTGVWNVGTIPANSSRVLTIVVQILTTGDIPNIANVTNVTENNTGNNTSSGTNVSVDPAVRLSITKTNNLTSTGNTANMLDLVEYYITVTNYGPNNGSNIRVIDVLDPSLQLVSLSGPGVHGQSGGVVSWNISTLNVGTNATLTITVRIVGTGTIPNSANITHVDQDNLGNNSTTGPSVTVPATVNLTITKTNNATGNASVNDIITYTITVANYGPDNATNVRVTDVLDDRLQFISSNLTYSRVGNTFTWNIGNLNVNQSINFTVTVMVVGTGNIPNIANVSAGQPNIGNNSSIPSNVTVPATVNLTIVKYSNVTSGNASFNDLVTYYVVVTNYGPDNATGVQVTENLDPRLEYLSHTFVGSVAGMSYVNGIWTIGSLNVNQSVTLEILVRINGTGDIPNVANVSAGQPNIGNGTNGTNISVPKTVNLTITKSSNVTGNVSFGDLVEYTIFVHNYGPDNATGVQVTDLLDPRLVLESYIASPGTTYTRSSGLWDIGTIIAGQNVTLVLTVRINGTGVIVNVANVSNLTEVNIGNNSTNSTNNGTNFTVPDTVNITITKVTHAPANVTVGDYVTYTITVTNNGPNNATNVTVNDRLDSRLVWVNDTSGGLYNPVTGVWNIVTLNVGETKTLNITVRVNGTGNIPNVANITVTEVNIGNNSTNSTPLDLPATVNLTITKVSNVTGAASYGDYVTYTIIVRNYGPDAAYNVVVTDVLDANLTYLGSNATNGTVYSPVSGQWLIPYLGLNDTYILEIRVQITGTGNISNVAIVNTTETNIGENISNTTNISVPRTVNLTIIKYSNATANVGFGDYVSYYITVTNNGPDIATGIVVTDVLDPRLEYLGHTSGMSYNYATGLWNIGTIGVNSTMTLEIRVRINGTGNIVNVANVTVTEVNIGNNSTNDTNNGTNFTVSDTVNITITKVTHAPANVTVGDYVTYTITVTNNGPNNASGVIVNDRLDGRLVWISDTSGGSYNPVTGVWNIVTLNVGETRTLNITVRVNGSGNIPNVANITVTEVNIGNNTTNSTPLDLPATVNLTIEKRSNVTGAASYGDYVTYTIIVRNYGPDAAYNVVVTDVLDLNLTYLGSNATNGTVYSPVSGQWLIPYLGLNDTYILEIRVQITGTGNISNVAIVNTTETNIGENVSNTTNISVPRTVNLTIIKYSNATANVGFGDLVSYYITVTNNGPDIATGIVVTDVLDPRLEYLGHTSGMSYNYATGLWNIGTIGVNSTMTLEIRVRINGTGNIVNVANVTVTEVNIGNNSTNDTNNGTNFTVSDTVNITITKVTHAPANVTVGDYVTYTITVTNNGPNNASGVIVNDRLDGRLVWISDTSGGLYNHTTGVWNIATLNVGETKTLNITVMVNGSGNIPNVANITVTEVNIGNNSTNGTPLVLPATVNLTITKVSNVTGIVNVDDEVMYTITVRNYGPDDANSVYVMDVLDSHLVFVRHSATAGYYNNNTGRWDIGLIRNGETVVLNITVRIKDVGVIPNIANVTADETNIANNTTGPVYVSSNLLLTNITVGNASGRATENVTISGTLFDENGVLINGTVNITVNGPGGPYTFNNIPVVNGQYNLTVVMNVSANYTVDVVYGGSVKYGASNNSSTLTIALMPTDTIVNNSTGVATNPAIVNGTVYDDNGVPITGLVNITIDGVLYPNVPVVNGHYSLSITMNISGIYNLTVVYGGNGTYAGSNTAGHLDIRRMPTETNITSVTGTAAEPVTINGTLYDRDGNPLTALVNITIEGPSGNLTFDNVSVVNGHFNLTVVLNVTGNYTVRAIYGGNGTYAGSDSRDLHSGSLNIRAMASITVVNNATGRATEPVVINGTVYGSNGVPINGTVNVTVNGVLYPNVSVVNGQYNLTVTMNTSGVYSVSVVYGGDATYGSSSSTGLLTITAMDSVTTITSGSTKPGVSIVLNGTVRDVNGVNITGLVDIYVDGVFYRTVNAVNGVFDVNITFNSVGNFTVRAVYNGNNIYGNSSALGSVFVDEITTNVSVSDAYSRTTEEAVIRGNVTNSLGFPVNGFVNVIINGTTYTVPVVNGQFSLTVVYNITYNYNLQVQYLGDAIFLPSSNNSAVMYISIMPTTTIVVDAPLRVNFTCNLTADLKDDNGKAIAGATVDFYVNGVFVGSNVTDSNGRAVYAYRPNAPGVYSVIAIYGGNQTYNNSIDNRNITAIKMGTVLIIDNIFTKPFINTTVGITVVDEFGSPVVNENVTVIIGGREYNLTTDGSGRVYVTYLTDEAGDIPISSSFNETILYRGNVSSGALHVEKILTYILIDNLSITTLDRADFNFTLVDEYGNILANRLVEVFLDGVSLGTFRTNANGMVFIKHGTLPKGVYSVTVTYAGDKAYASAVSDSWIDVRLVKTTLSVYRVTNHADSSTLFVAFLIDEFNRTVPYRTVSFMLDGVLIGTAMTDYNGRAVLTYFLNSNKVFDIMAEFVEDTVYEGSIASCTFEYNDLAPFDSPTPYNSSNLTDLISLIVDDVNASVGDEVELSARLTDGDGNPMVGCSVDFYVDGVFVGTGITDSDGVARINYTVTKSGRFVIEAIYNSSVNSSVNDTALLSASVDPYVDPVDPDDIEEDDNDDRPVSGAVGMLDTGNPIAMIALCLLSIFVIGFRRRKQKD